MPTVEELMAADPLAQPDTGSITAEELMAADPEGGIDFSRMPQYDAGQTFAKPEAEPRFKTKEEYDEYLYSTFADAVNNSPMGPFDPRVAAIAMLGLRKLTDALGIVDERMEERRQQDFAENNNYEDASLRRVGRRVASIGVDVGKFGMIGVPTFFDRLINPEAYQSTHGQEAVGMVTGLVDQIKDWPAVVGQEVGSTANDLLGQVYAAVGDTEAGPNIERNITDAGAWLTDLLGGDSQAAIERAKFNPGEIVTTPMMAAPFAAGAYRMGKGVYNFAKWKGEGYAPYRQQEILSDLTSAAEFARHEESIAHAKQHNSNVAMLYKEITGAADKDRALLTPEEQRQLTPEHQESIRVEREYGFRPEERSALATLLHDVFDYTSPENLNDLVAEVGRIRRENSLTRVEAVRRLIEERKDPEGLPTEVSPLRKDRLQGPKGGQVRMSVPKALDILADADWKQSLEEYGLYADKVKGDPNMAQRVIDRSVDKGNINEYNRQVRELYKNPDESLVADFDLDPASIGQMIIERDNLLREARNRKREALNTVLETDPRFTDVPRFIEEPKPYEPIRVPEEEAIQKGFNQLWKTGKIGASLIEGLKSFNAQHLRVTWRLAKQVDRITDGKMGFQMFEQLLEGENRANQIRHQQYGIINDIYSGRTGLWPKHTPEMIQASSERIGAHQLARQGEARALDKLGIKYEHIIDDAGRNAARITDKRMQLTPTDVQVSRFIDGELLRIGRPLMEHLNIWTKGKPMSFRDADVYAPVMRQMIADMNEGVPYAEAAANARNVAEKKVPLLPSQKARIGSDLPAKIDAVNNFTEYFESLAQRALHIETVKKIDATIKQGDLWSKDPKTALQLQDLQRNLMNIQPRKTPNMMWNLMSRLGGSAAKLIMARPWRTGPIQLSVVVNTLTEASVKTPNVYKHFVQVLDEVTGNYEGAKKVLNSSMDRSREMLNREHETVIQGKPKIGLAGQTVGLNRTLNVIDKGIDVLLEPMKSTDQWIYAISNEAIYRAAKEKGMSSAQARLHADMVGIASQGSANRFQVAGAQRKGNAAGRVMTILQTFALNERGFVANLLQGDVGKNPTQNAAKIAQYLALATVANELYEAVGISATIQNPVYAGVKAYLDDNEKTTVSGEAIKSAVSIAAPPFGASLRLRGYNTPLGQSLQWFGPGATMFGNTAQTLSEIPSALEQDDEGKYDKIMWKLLGIVPQVRDVNKFLTEDDEE